MTYINGETRGNSRKSATNVAEYVVGRLVDLGITNSFTVPGDYSFPIDKAIISNSKLKSIISANELNASYAADGYARIKGAAILCTTYAVGELSAINGVLGAKAENNIIFHLVGSPNSSVVAKKKCVHHTFGNGIFGNFNKLSEESACVSAVITADNAISEMNRIIKTAFKYRQPAYINISLDQAMLPVRDTSTEDLSCNVISSEKKNIDSAFDIISTAINQAKKIVVLPSIKLERYGISKVALNFIEKFKLPFVMMANDKNVLPIDHPNYAGFFGGDLSDEGVLDFVKNADLIINLGGALMSDFIFVWNSI